MRLAVVIPVLNEAARIADQCRRVTALAGVTDVVVVDGGSDDDTAALAAAVPGVRVLTAPRGRGTQLAAGAAAAGDADVLLFLHADVVLPPDAAAWVTRALTAPDVVAGAFRVRTVADGDGVRLGPLLRLADLRSHRTRLPYGDQAVFVRGAAYARAGGFPAQPLMEDVELARRLSRLGRIVTVPAEVRVSARRFAARPVRTVLCMRLFPWLYRLGVPPATLARLYGAPR